MKKRGLVLILSLLMTMAAVPGFQKTDRAYGETADPDIIWLKNTYEYVGNFSEDMALVKLERFYGFIDKTGKEVIPLRYESASDFSEGLARVFTGDFIFDEDGNGSYIGEGKWGYIDKTGKEVIPLKYEECLPFSEGLAAVRLNGKWGYVDKTGKEVIWLEEGMGESFKEGIARVVFGFYEEYGFIDKTGRKITAKRYRDADNFTESLARVTSIINHNYLDGFIDKTGKEVIPVKYNGSLSFSEGLAAVRPRESCGYIDKTGRLILDKYNSVSPFSEGMAFVMKNDKYGYIDKTGKYIIPLTNDFFPCDIPFCLFKEGIVLIRELTPDWKQYKYGYMDKTGKKITPLKYDSAHPFSEGLAAVTINNKSGYIDKTGKEVIPLIYDSTSYYYDTYKNDNAGSDFKEGVAIVKLDNKYGIMKNPISTIKTSEAEAPKDNKISAKPTASKILVNNKEIAFEAYNISGNNYFKLRDIAAAVNNTGKSFEVTWDGANNAIRLISGKNYTAVGGELAIPASLTDVEAMPATSKIFLNNKEVRFIAYNIKGNNYFKLRDIGKAIDFGVAWDGKTNSISIDSSVSYTE